MNGESGSGIVQDLANLAMSVSDAWPDRYGLAYARRIAKTATDLKQIELVRDQIHDRAEKIKQVCDEIIAENSTSKKYTRSRR